MNPILIPKDYDYVGIYLTDKCHLQCPYCITQHHGAAFGKYNYEYLNAEQWVQGLNRLVLPQDVPLTFQGGEPFLYPDIWQVLEGINHKVDILTALPSYLTKKHFLQLKTLKWNKRHAPYPTMRVSYHKGQNHYKELIERIAELQEILNIGLYYLDGPFYEEGELDEIKKYAMKWKVELRAKEFLGQYQGKKYGTLLYEDAAEGIQKGVSVLCKNTVVPISPDGTIYRCHSDLYFNRQDLALGNIFFKNCQLPTGYLGCNSYGLCSECDVKIKTNHAQEYGYTSVDIQFQKNEVQHAI